MTRTARTRSATEVQWAMNCRAGEIGVREPSYPPGFIRIAVAKRR